ncbi:unnamed protein product [Microthlaspi erraticum]|uniref:Serine/threonine-protein kinase BSK n=1 Tax=Microthlaspi erraticum TaxID=1685480 RepID=A0A6D2IQS7_9BRAS|nr:unnamed protein product [Microthlaspi erraticum]
METKQILLPNSFPAIGLSLKCMNEMRHNTILEFSPEEVLSWIPYLEEVKAVGHLRNERLVDLIAFCCEGDEILLVAEFMPFETFSKHLFYLYRWGGCMLLRRIL